ncbi:MAG: hypothetical protein ABSH34_21545, partial [Verrucomicrobiota bacterium]
MKTAMQQHSLASRPRHSGALGLRLASMLLLGAACHAAAGEPPAGVVSHIKVLSDKVPDVSSL